MSRIKLLIGLIFYLTNVESFPQTSLFNKQMEIGFDEKQGELIALDTRLINEAGDTVWLKDILNKPTILSLVYFECPGTCSPLMWGISKFIDAVDLVPGKDYDIFTISFNPAESIDLGVSKKANYVSTMKKKEFAVNWRFFVSDSLNIAKLTNSVGFRYQLINGQYVHPTGLIALAGNGKITRYMRGIDFLPFDIKITMVEAAAGKVGPPINRLLSICYSYDTQGNQYVFNVTRVSAIVILFIVFLIFSYLALSRLNFKKLISRK